MVQFNPHFSRGFHPWLPPPWESPAASASAKSCTKTSRRCLQASPPESLGDRGILTVKNGKFTRKNMDLIGVYHELAFFFGISDLIMKSGDWQNQDFSQRNVEMIGFDGRWNTAQTTVLNPGMGCSSKVRDKPQYPNRQVGWWPGSEFSFLMFMVGESTLRQI